MSEEYPRIETMHETTIDLKLLQHQLDAVESALLMAWREMNRLYPPQKDQQISDALDALLAVKKSLNLKSDLQPVKEQPSAATTRWVMIPKSTREQEST